MSQDVQIQFIPRLRQPYFIEVFNLLEQSIIHVHDIYKLEIESKIHLIQTITNFECMLERMLTKNVNSVIFLSDIPKIFCRIYQYMFKLVADEIGSRNENLTYIKIILNKIRVCMLYIFKIFI